MTWIRAGCRPSLRSGAAVWRRRVGGPGRLAREKRGEGRAGAEPLHCVVCGEPTEALDPRRDAWVCAAHALHVSRPERRAVEATERDDRTAPTHYLIGKRAE